jgi:hypothetical protein
MIPGVDTHVRATPTNTTGLPKASADSPLRVEVLVRERSQIADNVAQSDTLLAA